MNRLTRKTSIGDYSGIEGFASVYDELQALRNRLGRYEDTGLEPNEIYVPLDCDDDLNKTAEKYKIPQEVEEKIPQYFIAAFTGELVSVFGRDITLVDCDNNYNVWFVTGTYGWRNAFYSACNKLELKELFAYRESLEWYESDYFDCIICEMVCDFLNGNMESSEAYCNYIKEREKEYENQD